MAISAEVIEAVMRLRDELSPKLLQISGNLKKAGASMQRTGASMTKNLTLPIAAVGFAAIKAFGDFDSAMTSSLAIMGDVSDEMRGNMSDAAREVAKVTTFSATEAAESFFFLASAGLDAAASIEALPQVAKFAQAGAFDMALATDLLTDAQSALGLTIRDDVVKNMENMARVSDVLVKANSVANASVQEFSEALTNKAGAAMRDLNIDIEAGVAVLAAWADQGVKGSEAGERLNIVTRDLQTAARNNAEEFERFNIAVFDQSGKFRELADIVEDMEDALGGMSDREKGATLATLGFTSKSIAATKSLLGLSGAIRGYEADLRSAGGVTDEVSNKQLQSFWAQLGLLKSRLIDVAISLGQELVPIVKDAIPTVERIAEVVAGAVRWFGDLPGPVKGAAVAIAAIVAVAGPVIVVLGSLVSAVGVLTGAIVGAGGLIAVLTGPVGLVAALAILVIKVPLVRGIFADIAEAALIVAERITGLTLRVREFNRVTKVSTEEESSFLAMLSGGGPTLTTVTRQVGDLWRVKLDMAQATEDAAKALDNQFTPAINTAMGAIAKINVVLGDHAAMMIRTNEIMVDFGGATLPKVVPQIQRVAEETDVATAEFTAMFSTINTGNSTIDGFLSRIKSFLGIFKSIGSALADLGGVFGGFFSSLGGLFKGGGEDAADGFLSGFGGEDGTGIMSKMGDFMKAAGPWIAIGLAVAGPLLKGIKAGLGAIVGFFKGLFGGPSAAEIAGREAAATYRDAVRDTLSDDVLADVLRLFPDDIEGASFLAGIQQQLIAAGVAADAASIQAQAWGLALFEAEKQGADAVAAVIAQIVAATQAGADAIDTITTTSTTLMDRRIAKITETVNAAGLTVEQTADRIALRIQRSADRIAARNGAAGTIETGFMAIADSISNTMGEAGSNTEKTARKAARAIERAARKAKREYDRMADDALASTTASGLHFDSLAASITNTFKDMKFEIPIIPKLPDDLPAGPSGRGKGGIQGFEHGGTVPGPIGAPLLVVAHGGETFTPAGRGGGGSDRPVILQLVVGGDVLAESHAKTLRELGIS